MLAGIGALVKQANGDQNSYSFHIEQARSCKTFRKTSINVVLEF